VHEQTHQPLLSTLSALVETVVELKRHGHKVVLVSSGAIAVGLKRMNVAKKPDNLSGKQVYFFFSTQVYLFIRYLWNVGSCSYRARKVDCTMG